MYCPPAEEVARRRVRLADRITGPSRGGYLLLPGYSCWNEGLPRVRSITGSVAALPQEERTARPLEKVFCSTCTTSSGVEPCRDLIKKPTLIGQVKQPWHTSVPRLGLILADIWKSVTKLERKWLLFILIMGIEKSLSILLFEHGNVLPGYGCWNRGCQGYEASLVPWRHCHERAERTARPLGRVCLLHLHCIQRCWTLLRPYMEANPHRTGEVTMAYLGRSTGLDPCGRLKVSDKVE